MSIYKIFMKLMSKHLLFHLVLPLIVGVAVEIFIAWYRDPSHFALREYLISKERVGFYLGIMVTYLCIAGWFVHKDAAPPWDNTLTATLDRTLKDAISFFATCTIPMEKWFDPYTQQYF